MSEEFLWGASTAAHQIEGGITNDWSAWERRTAAERARKAKRFGWLRHHRRWPRIRNDATNPEHYVTGAATRHRERYKEDIQMASDLGLNTLRISLSWARIEPEEGNFNDDALNYYSDVIATMRSYDITPVVTTWHFTHPTWFTERGGWLEDDAVSKFERFVRTAAARFGEQVPYWVTLNEPAGWTRAAHLFGNYPPHNSSLQTMRSVQQTLQEAHRRVTPVLQDAGARVGVAMAMGAFEAYADNPLNRWLADKLRYFEHGSFLDGIDDAVDFIGVNYYYQYAIDVLLRNLPSRITLPRSDMGWPLVPNGLRTVIEAAASRDVPVIVTEHGLADTEDKHRAQYIKDSLDVIEECRRDGLPVNGYLHWSLLDNVEWDKGIWPRFGLVEVDYDTFERTPRDSAYAYRDAIADRDWKATW